MDRDEQRVVTGTSIAAYALAQMTFVALLTSGLLSKADAEGMLQQVIASNQIGGGPANRIAADMLTAVLRNIPAIPVQSKQ